jgi:hypothetical protein
VPNLGSWFVTEASLRTRCFRSEDAHGQPWPRSGRAGGTGRGVHVRPPTDVADGRTSRDGTTPPSWARPAGCCLGAQLCPRSRALRFPSRARSRMLRLRCRVVDDSDAILALFLGGISTHGERSARWFSSASYTPTTFRWLRKACNHTALRERRNRFPKPKVTGSTPVRSATPRFASYDGSANGRHVTPSADGVAECGRQTT